ncbi:MAG: 1-acyl-sn-glycerol-3-phosphate acyltransferase [Candidatus Thermoplasmatota archaeon]|nr:1-acyl-sn-glycerol-3-phosphate acyltransferase [Candidatus Thermoplasmatota archaeon]
MLGGEIKSGRLWPHHMSWLKDPEGQDHQKLSLTYRMLRRFNRSLMSVWFRELDIVDNENIPHEGGIMFVSWHPSGLIDPMLLHASLPGKLSILAKHTLFDMPIIGRMIRGGGGLPIYRAKDSDNVELAKSNNAAMLENAGTEIANGGRLLLFPEGRTHTESDVSKAKTGAARIMLNALRSAQNSNLPTPTLIPVGLHYSNSNKFRERGAVILERPMDLPEIPPNLDNDEEQMLVDQNWVLEVTDSIESELRRASLSKTTWEERRLIWLARSVAYAERAAQSGEKLQRPSYADSVIGARRLRAGWEYYNANDPERIAPLVEQSKNHFAELESIEATPYDVAAKPEKPTFFGYLTALASWLWVAAWMLGLVTWSAILGNVPPYQANYLTMWQLRKRGAEESIYGTLKIGVAVIMFPIWWIFVSLAVTVMFLATESPIYILLNKHWLLAYFTQINPVIMFFVLMFWWPTSGKLHMKLYSRLVWNWRNLKRWKNWRKNQQYWKELHTRQRNIGAMLIDLGDGLVLPGDEEWQDPITGSDDYNYVKSRV